MKSQNKTRRFAKLFSQYLPSTMVFKCGLVLLIICTVAAFVIAYYHDAYSSILEMKELAATDVWFKLFVILMVLGAALLVGSPLLAMINARYQSRGSCSRRSGSGSKTAHIVKY